MVIHLKPPELSASGGWILGYTFVELHLNKAVFRRLLKSQIVLPLRIWASPSSGSLTSSCRPQLMGRLLLSTKAAIWTDWHRYYEMSSQALMIKMFLGSPNGFPCDIQPFALNISLCTIPVSLWHSSPTNILEAFLWPLNVLLPKSSVSDYSLKSTVDIP